MKNPVGVTSPSVAVRGSRVNSSVTLAERAETNVQETMLIWAIGHRPSRERGEKAGSALQLCRIRGRLGPALQVTFLV